MENSHMVAIGQMVASVGKSLLGGLQAREHQRRPLHHSRERVVLPKETRWGGYQ